MRWIWNHWHEFLLITLLAAMFYALGGIPEIVGIRICEVEVFSLACFGACLFFVGILCAWLAMALVFRTLNRFMDMGHFEEAFEEMKPQEQVFLIVGSFAGLIFLFAYCCSLLS
ncbi:MAG: hypothetical protein ACOY3I_07710 [Verrucomicrobiota bacterium]